MWYLQASYFKVQEQDRALSALSGLHPTVDALPPYIHRVRCPYCLFLPYSGLSCPIWRRDIGDFVVLRMNDQVVYVTHVLQFRSRDFGE